MRKSTEEKERRRIQRGNARGALYEVPVGKHGKGATVDVESVLKAIESAKPRANPHKEVGDHRDAMTKLTR